MEHRTSPSEVPGEIARRLGDEDLALGVAESLTGGCLSERFAKAENSSDWYRGAIVSYARSVKHEVLGVPDGPVVSEAAAAAMAEGVCELLDADIALAVTGAGGPEPQDDQPPGTVWMAVHDRRDGTTLTRHERFPGDPEQVVSATCDVGSAWLLDHLTVDGSEGAGAAT